MRRTSALILGGGPAGSAAAIALARGGVRPLLLERTREPADALCGGFMSWATLARLETLGVEDLGGHAIERVRIFAAHASAEARLPGGAVGLSRRSLDSALLDRAAECGTEIERGVMVRGVENGRARLGDGTDITADAVFLATGKHDVRGIGRASVGDDPTLGLRVALAPHPALTRLLGSAIELHLFDRGYAGLLLQEDGRANLCLAVRKSRLAEAGGRPMALLEAWGAEGALGERLAFLSTEAIVDAIASVPYGWRTTTTARGVFRLGDQAAVIPSLAGEGMGIALASGIAAAERNCAGGPHASIAFQRAFARRARRPVTMASIAWHLCEDRRAGKAAVGVIAALPALATLIARATRIGA